VQPEGRSPDLRPSLADVAVQARKGWERDSTNGKADDGLLGPFDREDVLSIVRYSVAKLAVFKLVPYL
jgi:hypothetical protein